MKNLNLEIKRFFMENYIENRHLRKLANKYRAKSEFEQRTQIKTAPIRYGLAVILNDKRNELADNYARDNITINAFEVMKLIYNIDSKLKPASRDYIKKELNKYIYATNSDLGLLVELFACASYQHEENEVSIGDFNGGPDITITHEGKTFKMECKSVSLRSKAGEKHKGLELLLKEIREQSDKIQSNKVSSAWQVEYPERIRTKHHAKVLVDQIASLSSKNIAYAIPLDRGSDWARVRSVGFALGISTQSGVFERAASKLGGHALHNSADFTVEIIEGTERPDPLWGIMLVTIDDHETLLNRCEDAFREAMKQLNRDNNGGLKVAYISIAAPYQLYKIAEGLVRKDDLHPYLMQLVHIYSEAIFEKISKSSNWEACFGVKLEFVWAPVVFDIGVQWRRYFTWMSHTGQSAAVDLPPRVGL